MDDADDDGPMDVRIMNEYTVTLPLWFDGGLADDDDLPISDGLRRDLEAFAARWDAAVDEDVFDDRFDTMPPVRFVVDTWRATKWRLSPGKRRDAAAEDAAIRETGESLRGRLQAEPGDGYRVTYQH